MRNPEEREKERDQCFVALISFQQWGSYLASRGSADSNEAHTYNYGRNAKLSMTKLFW